MLSDRQSVSYTDNDQLISKRQHVVEKSSSSPLKLCIFIKVGSQHQNPRNSRKLICAKINPVKVIAGMAAVQSVKPKETYEAWFKMLIKFITPPNESAASSIDIIMDTYTWQKV